MAENSGRERRDGSAVRAARAFSAERRPIAA